MCACVQMCVQAHVGVLCTHVCTRWHVYTCEHVCVHDTCVSSHVHVVCVRACISGPSSKGILGGTLASPALSRSLAAHWAWDQLLLPARPACRRVGGTPPVPGWPRPCSLHLCSAHGEPHGVFILLHRSGDASSRPALNQFPKPSPSVSSGSAITIFFRFKET